ncbi:MAG: hypothetical protein HRT87_01900, partial [Legionellales bacterium]|nr:hypothetical protein [Legionellales bacterium]
TVPTAYFLLDFISGDQNNNHEEAISKSMNIFSKWREWDKDRALNEFVQRFERSNKSLKAAIASVFGSVLINIIATGDVRDKKRVKIIINTLRGKDYSYVINSYRKIFYERHKTKIGKLLEEFYTKYYF